MPYTSHGHPYGTVDTSAPRPPVSRCGGPGICRKCSAEAGVHVRGVDDRLPDAERSVSPAERIARAFHTEYERLAPYLGYETRPESAVPWEQVPEPNKALMIAVCGTLLGNGTIKAG